MDQFCKLFCKFHINFNVKLFAHSDRPVDTDADGKPLHIPSGSVESGSGTGSIGTVSSGVSGVDTLHSHTTSGDEVDVYTAEVDGIAPMRVVVSGDSMAIISGQQFSGGRRESVLSGGAPPPRVEKRRKSGETAEELAIQAKIENIFLEKVKICG